MAKSKSILAELTGCPHCGGENGYHTKEVVDYKQLYCWEGEHTWGNSGQQIVLLLRLWPQHHKTHHPASSTVSMDTAEVK